MRTAAEFNLYYAKPDPWRVSRSSFRDRVLRDRLVGFITDSSILELGCGEGHLTETLFADARAVTGIDISEVAIGRAMARHLPRARFECRDFLGAPFGGYDVIAALECVYYLAAEEREQFFAKVAREHRGKPLILSAPIIGGQYFTHDELMTAFQRHGFAVLEYRNIFVDWRSPAEIIAGRMVRLPFCLWLLDLLPESFIRQRSYVVAAR